MAREPPAWSFVVLQLARSRLPRQNPLVPRHSMSSSPLLMIVAASAVLLPSSFSCYMDGKICQGVDKSAKVRGDGLTLPKNASGLLSNLRNFYPPLLTPSSIICCPSSVLQEVTGMSAQQSCRKTFLPNRFTCLSLSQVAGWIVGALSLF